MATTNYSIPTIEPTAKINIPVDVNAALNAIDGELAKKAPTNHASADTLYGVGSEGNYGHLKVTDSITAAGAASGIALSPKAIYDMGIIRNAAVVISDSYVAGNGPCPFFIPQMQEEFSEFNFIDYGDSGSGYRLGGVDGKTFLQQIQNAASSIESDHNISPNDVGYVLIIGGRNDAGGADSTGIPKWGDMYTACKKAFTAARTSFPNAKVCAFLLYDWKLPNGAIMTVQNAMKQAGMETGCYVATGSWSIGTGKMGTLYKGGTDIHPNETGAKLMGEYIMNAIITDNYDMMCGQTFSYWSEAFGNNTYVSLDSAGINIFAAGTKPTNTNVIVPIAACPPFLKSANNHETNWFADGSTFIGVDTPYGIPCINTANGAYAGILQLSQLGINTTMVPNGTSIAVFAKIPYTFNDKMSLG